MGDGYCDDKSLTFSCTQHCCSNEFPMLYDIMRMFGSDYEAHDGGSTDDFENWLNGVDNDE